MLDFEKQKWEVVGCEFSQPAKFRKVAKISASGPEKINTKKKFAEN